MPLTLNDIRDRLADHREVLRNFKVRSLFVFGSVARGEANQGSDVDLLVEFAEPVGLFEFARLQRFLEESLRARVDLVTRAALRESMREEVLREAVRAA